MRGFRLFALRIKRELLTSLQAKLFIGGGPYPTRLFVRATDYCRATGTRRLFVAPSNSVGGTTARSVSDEGMRTPPRPTSLLRNLLQNVSDARLLVLTHFRFD